jgi:hypothetical protein
MCQRRPRQIDSERRWYFGDGILRRGRGCVLRCPCTPVETRRRGVECTCTCGPSGGEGAFEAVDLAAGDGASPYASPPLGTDAGHRFLDLCRFSVSKGVIADVGSESRDPVVGGEHLVSGPERRPGPYLGVGHAGGFCIEVNANLLVFWVTVDQPRAHRRPRPGCGQDSSRRYASGHGSSSSGSSELSLLLERAL